MKAGFSVIGIYWRRDSADLMKLPAVDALTIGNDGYEVLGFSWEIGGVYEVASSMPRLFTIRTYRAACVSDFELALEFHSGDNVHPKFECLEQVVAYFSPNERPAEVLFHVLTRSISSGVQDIDIEDFARRLGLNEGWDWDDVWAMVDGGGFTVLDIYREIESEDMSWRQRTI